MRRAALALCALTVLGACGERRPGVTVGQADAPGRVPGFALDLPADSLAEADSLLVAEADSLADAAAEPDAPPDFSVFWTEFREAARAGRAGALAMPAARAGLEVALAPPFRDGVLALAPRDFARTGTRRAATVRVGFDAAGRVVPEDEAVTDSAVALTFDLEGGAYRLVAADVSG